MKLQVVKENPQPPPRLFVFDFTEDEARQLLRYVSINSTSYPVVNEIHRELNRYIVNPFS